MEDRTMFGRRGIAAADRLTEEGYPALRALPAEVEA